MQNIVGTLSVVATTALGGGVLSDWSSGRATYYTFWQSGGSCSMGTVPTDSFPYGYIAAPNEAWYDSSDTCGHCYEVECVDSWYETPNCCKNETVVIQVTDQCPESGNEQWCAGDENHLDLSDLAFAKIANPNCGVVETRYRRVDCSFGSNAPIVWGSSSGINQWWYAVVIKDVNGYGHVSNVEIREPESSTWHSGERKTWNVWVFDDAPDGYWHAPLDARVSGVQRGEAAVTALELVTSFDEMVDYPMGDNFPLHSDGHFVAPFLPLLASIIMLNWFVYD